MGHRKWPWLQNNVTVKSPARGPSQLNVQVRLTGPLLYSFTLVLVLIFWSEKCFVFFLLLLLLLLLFCFVLFCFFWFFLFCFVLCFVFVLFCFVLFCFLFLFLFLLLLLLFCFFVCFWLVLIPHVNCYEGSNWQLLCETWLNLYYSWQNLPIPRDRSQTLVRGAWCKKGGP